MGFAVVNVEYRLARVSLAPAAVEDCRCVLHWVGRKANEYNFDLKKVVVTGASAGGHLALTTAMIPSTAGFEDQCANDDDPQGGAGAWTNPWPPVAAVINWFGITDVNELLHGDSTRAYAVTWLGRQPDRETIAKSVSPLSYVRPGIPPILTIHGDKDTFVPYEQAVRFHHALEAAGVKNQLVTIHGKSTETSIYARTRRPGMQSGNSLRRSVSPRYRWLHDDAVAQRPDLIDLHDDFIPIPQPPGRVSS